MTDFNAEYMVAISKSKNINYPEQAPFHPSCSYPEYLGMVSCEQNDVYEAVRNTFQILNYDSENIEKKSWNPLKKIISEGNTVLLKPNFVLHRNMGKGTIWSVITHPSVIRAVIDYVYIALHGKGKIIIADAPQADADFEGILQSTQLMEIVKYYRERYNFGIAVYDLRQLKFKYVDGVLLENSRIEMDGDPLGYTIFDVGKKSYFSDIDSPQRLYGADYDREETVRHHSDGKHEYCIANSVINADVVISLAKMKTHRKGG